MLSAIKTAKPPLSSMPAVPPFPTEQRPASEIFGAQAAQSGSRVLLAADFDGISQAIHFLYPQARCIASPLPQVTSGIELKNCEPSDLQAVDVAVLNGQLGVAENGAVWIAEEDMVHRVLPFITQHLVLLLPQDQIVYNMHEAYQQITIDEGGFGLFVAGPSKTADIEQSLVIGAQAARSLTIFLT